MARCQGVGALQFSVGKYVSGPLPDVGETQLRGFLTDFGARRGLRISGVSTGLGRNRFIVGTHEAGGELIRVWYVTNGRDLALVTYVARDDGDDSRRLVLAELEDADGIVRSTDFASGPS